MANLNVLKPCHRNYQFTILSKYSSRPVNTPTNDYISSIASPISKVISSRRRKLAIRACANGETEKTTERRSFLTIEEAGLVEMSGLSTHERFLCRLTISSLNLLRVIAEQEGCSIEELNAGRVCDWFLKDKLKSEQNLGSSVLQWEDSDFQL